MMLTAACNAHVKAPPRAHPLLAWLVILAVVVFVVVRTAQTASLREERMAQIFSDIQSRILVGMLQLIKDNATEWKQIELGLDRGPYSERLRFIVIIGAMTGPTEALDRLSQLNQHWQERGESLSEEDADCTALLERLYRASANGSGPAADLQSVKRTQLERNLGWSGQLALAEPDSVARATLLAEALRTAVVSIVLIFAFLGLMALGIVLVILVGILGNKGRMQGRLPQRTGRGGFYAETFAIWMVAYVLLSLVVGRLPFHSSRLLLMSVAMLVSLGVLFWPRWRGLSWQQVRTDLGLFAGPRPGREILIGLGTYAVAMLGAVAMALVFTGVLTLLGRLFGGNQGNAPPSAPGHPVVEMLAGGDLWVKVQVILAAVLVAPLVEETVFRGLLYRHLRDALAGAGQTTSVVLAGIASGLVFAIIHPQGFLAVPMLATLALVFALVREWRGTLIPSMVAHGVNNGALVLALIGLTA
jgi:membrane protease YdiL (CAAX protease family)